MARWKALGRLSIGADRTVFAIVSGCQITPKRGVVRVICPIFIAQRYASGCAVYVFWHHDCVCLTVCLSQV